MTGEGRGSWQGRDRLQLLQIETTPWGGDREGCNRNCIQGLLIGKCCWDRKAANGSWDLVTVGRFLPSVPRGLSLPVCHATLSPSMPFTLIAPLYLAFPF